MMAASPAAVKIFVTDAIADTVDRYPESVHALIWLVNELGLGPMGDTPESRARHKMTVEKIMGIPL